MENNVLKGKNCFITGATGSLGDCLAQKFAEKGCNLFLTSRSINKLQGSAKKIKSTVRDIEVFYEAGDLQKVEDIYKIIKRAKEELKSVDILVNNAGIFQIKSIQESNVEDFDSIFNINVRAPFILCKELSEDMISKRWGRIINIGSTSAYNGFKNTSLYCASKHALLGLSRSLHDELKKYNVRVFCVSPGTLISEMGKLVEEKFNLNPESFIDPEEMAEYIVFAVSFDTEMISEEIRLNRMQEFMEHL